MHNNGCTHKLEILSMTQLTLISKDVPVLMNKKHNSSSHFVMATKTNEQKRYILKYFFLFSTKEGQS